MSRFAGDAPTPGAMALRIWEILIHDARNRHTPTYIEIARKVGYRGARPIIPSLYRILYYCLQEGLPILTAIVISKKTGLPREGISEVGMIITRENFPRIQENIFRYDWASVTRPTPEDLEEAYTIGRRKQG